MSLWRKSRVDFKAKVIKSEIKFLKRRLIEKIKPALLSPTPAYNKPPAEIFSIRKIRKYLCDEEIEAVIKSSSTWKRAQFRLVDSLVRRFAYEVDEHADPASWAWHQRYEQWKKMRDELESEAEASDSSPLSLADPSKKIRPPYFFENMHSNKNFIGRGRR